MKRVVVSAALLLFVAAHVEAQERAPSGPAEVIQRARDAREAPVLPPDHPPVQGEDEIPVTEESVRRALSGAEIARALADEAVSAGTIAVLVVDHRGAPVAGQKVRVGIMRAEGGRSELEALTDEAGEARFEGLPTGVEQSYRPSIEFDGARAATNPFRLEPDRGMRVELRRLQVTRDPRYLLQTLASTQLEFRQPGRVRVTQGARLLNPTTHAYVFPEGGHAVTLPEGAVAFQTRASMGDQRIIPSEGGFRVEGSVPPGSVELVWAYDLPLSGDTFELRMPMAFRNTMSHRVIVEQVQGMDVAVEGMGGAFTHTLGGKRQLIVERQMRATDPPLETLAIRLTGIPSEGPLRTAAAWISALLALLGVAALFVAKGRAPQGSPIKEAAIARLVEEIRALDREREAGEIGPEYHARTRGEKMAELAELIDEAPARGPA